MHEFKNFMAKLDMADVPSIENKFSWFSRGAVS